MSKPSAPAAPDYTGAAQQTAAGNLTNLKYQTTANRPTMITPWGTSTWSATDANGNATNTVSLSPQEQQALNSQMAVQNNQSTLANTLQGQVSKTMASGFNAPSLSSYMSGVPKVNTNAPTFDQSTADAGTQAAYKAAMGLDRKAHV